MIFKHSNISLLKLSLIFLFTYIGLITNILSFQTKEHKKISREYLDNLKKTAGFKIYDYSTHPFKDIEFETLKKRFNIFDIPQIELDKLPIRSEFDFTELPANFNSKDKWVGCIHPIRNQLNCGACWAFASTDVLSDRLCIKSKRAINVVLSVQDPIDCDTNELGCDGGYLEKTWQYLINKGTLSDQCKPYVSGYGHVEPCTSTCSNPLISNIRYRAYQYRRFQYVNDIKTEIISYGPVETGFLVYDDFMSYSGGIYKKTSNNLLGGHAVRVVGWGIENNDEYWIVANSWGSSWGEEGFFRIAINNCCNFESQVIAGYALLSTTKEKDREMEDKTPLFHKHKPPFDSIDIEGF